MEALGKNPPAAPKGFFGVDNKPACPIILAKPHTITTLLHPIPVMFPASPSPEMAIKQPEVLPPFLQLGLSPAQKAATATTTPAALPTLPSAGGISLSTSAGGSTEIKPLTSSALFKSLNLTSSATTTATTTTAAIETAVIPLNALPGLTPSVKPQAKKEAAPAQQQQQPKKMTATSATFVPRAHSQSAPRAPKKDSADNTKGQKSNNKDTKVKVDHKKKAALDKTAFPSSFAAPSKNTTTTTTTIKPVLNFLETCSKQADPEVLEQQKKLLAAKKKQQEEEKRAKAEELAVAKAAAVLATAEGSDVKEQKPKKQPKAKAPKEDGEKTATEKKQSQQPKKQKEKKDVAAAKVAAAPAPPVAVNAAPIEQPAPAGSWAAVLNK